MKLIWKNMKSELRWDGIGDEDSSPCDIRMIWILSSEPIWFEETKGYGI